MTIATEQQAPVVSDYARGVCDEILNFIVEHIRLTGFRPTFREIGAHAHLSLTTVHRYMHILERLGLITFDGNRRRWRVVD